MKHFIDFAAIKAFASVLLIELVELIPLMTDISKFVVQSSIGVITFLYIFRKYKQLGRENTKQKTNGKK